MTFGWVLRDCSCDFCLYDLCVSSLSSRVKDTVCGSSFSPEWMCNICELAGSGYTKATHKLLNVCVIRCASDGQSGHLLLLTQSCMGNRYKWLTFTLMTLWGGRVLLKRVSVAVNYTSQCAEMPTTFREASCINLCVVHCKAHWNSSCCI